MKIKLLAAFTFLLLVGKAYSQNIELWGTALNGGPTEGGTIFKINNDGSGYSNQYYFQVPYSPVGDLYQAQDNKIYGMTPGGGANGAGTIFRLDPINNIKTDLYSFNIPTGTIPYGSLIQLTNGKLYGMTKNGGTHNVGVIFSFDPLSSLYTVLHNFDSTYGANPYGSLMNASDGKLYGMTAIGGSYNSGVLFSFDTTSNVYVDLMDFDGINGKYPSGNVIQASNGLLYGMTSQGGSYGKGNIFSYDILNSIYSSLVDLNDSIGRYPQGSLMQSSNGKLYGLTLFGGAGYGVLFSYEIGSNIFTDLHYFDFVNGGWPSNSLIEDANGNLYGISDGGTNSGVIFSYDTTVNSYIPLYQLNSNEGVSPRSSLIQATNGKFYSMTNGGGANNAGVIFSYDLIVYSMLFEFPGTTGYGSVSGFIKADNGKFYGLNAGGGAHNLGALYSYDPLNSVYTDLYDFDEVHGSNPDGGLMQASNGLLYGMANGGGTTDNGVLFSYDILSDVFTDLIHFDGTNGSYPSHTRLIELSNGKLYGTTYGGGTGNGNIFSYDISSGVLNSLYDFDGTSGGFPRSTLMQATDSLLYGTALGGANNKGVIYSFNISNNVYTDLFDFDIATGYNSRSQLVEAANGKLYGMTRFGGANDSGVIFTYDPGTMIYSDILDFSTANGAFPFGNLMKASDGNLYGCAGDGGANNAGVIFSLDPSTNIFTKLYDLNFYEGINPTELIEVDSLVGINEVLNSEEIKIYPNPISSTSIIFFNKELKDAEVVIYDVLGKEMMRKKMGGDKMQIEKGSLSSGCYTVIVKHNDRQSALKLIVE